MDENLQGTHIQEKTRNYEDCHDNIQSSDRLNGTYFEDISQIVGLLVERVVGEWVTDQTADTKCTKYEYQKYGSGGTTKESDE